MKKKLQRFQPERNSWQMMRARCNNPKATLYHRYGGRGIRVCERRNDFMNFVADMGLRPPGTTLDRKDGNGNYEPSNCRWATRKEQQNNVRWPMSDRTHCPKGHEYSGSNLLLIRGGTARDCRACQRQRNLEYARRKRALSKETRASV